MYGFVLVALALFLVEVNGKLLACSAKFPMEVGVFDLSYQATTRACSASLAFHGFQVEVAKGHSAEVSSIGDTAVGTREGGEKSNATYNHHEVLGLQGEQHVHVKNA